MDTSTEVTEPISPPAPPPSVSAPVARESTSPAGSIALGLSRADRWFVGTLLTVGLTLLTIYGLRLSHWGRETIEIRRQSPLELVYKLDINRATWVEWAQLEGIGPNTARKIVADRDAHGPFKSVDDLERVNGIGAKTVARLRPQLICTPDEQTPPQETTGSLQP
ncbi:MAG: helix-hairpin-helix domain-containing protein [Planctomycetales bacterium]